MTPAACALRRAEVGLTAHLEDLLETKPVPWPQVAAIAANLATIRMATAPGAHGGLLTTQQLAERLAVSTRTIGRRRRSGELTPAIGGSKGHKGRSVVRWAAP